MSGLHVGFCKWLLCAGVLFARAACAEDPPPPDTARLVFSEDWSCGAIDLEKWYLLRKQWGQGNHGVVPENVRVEQDQVGDRQKNVLVCVAHGDEYDGPIVGRGGQTTRVGGVIVSKPFFASGRFEVVMKIGPPEPQDSDSEHPGWPQGAVPAIWTYGYRWVEVDAQNKENFVPETPLYNPHMPVYGRSANEYWSELDFPELGKYGDFAKGLYNTFCQNRHDPRLFDVSVVADGAYHTFTTEWRTELEPLPEVTDEQVTKHLNYWLGQGQVRSVRIVSWQSAEAPGRESLRGLSGCEGDALDRRKESRRKHAVCPCDGCTTQSGRMVAGVGGSGAVGDCGSFFRLCEGLAI